MKKIRQVFGNKTVLNGLKLMLILALLAGFFYYIPLSKILDVLQKVDLPPLLWTVVVSMLAIYISSIELWVLTSKQGIRYSINKLFLLNLGIRFYSFFSPLSSVGSLLRWQRLGSHGKSAEGLVAIAANRVLDIIVAVAIGLFWGITALNQDAINAPLIVTYLVGFFVVLWLLLKFSEPAAIWSRRKSEASQKRYIAKGFGLVARLFTSLGIYRSFSRTEMLILTCTALIGELITLLAYVLIAMSVHISITVVDLGWMRSLLFLAALAPFTLAGGFGLREVSAVVIMTGLGIAADQAAAFSLLIYARSVVVSVIGGGTELFQFLLDQQADRKIPHP